MTLDYDAGGRLVQRTDATGTTTYVYDRLNRVTEEHLPGGRVNAYTYDATGNLKTMTDATGVVTYGYNAVNLVDTLVEPGGATTTFAYDDDDNRKLTTYPNGTSQAVLYDASSRIDAIEGKQGTTLLTRFSYTYKLGISDTALRQTVTDKDNRTTTYGYDRLDRLKQAQTKAGTSVVADYAYDYDAVGNRISEIINGTTTTAAFNAADQLTSRAGVTYSYDLNGNQTGSSAGQALAYNAADQTASLKRAGGTALASTYAGANQVERATAGSTTFTNSMLGLTVATDAGATAYTRDPAGGLVGIRGTNRSYYLFDGLGSVVAVTDANGGVTNTYTYDPYGVTTETKAAGTNVSNPWRYAGQYQDVSTGLYKMGARYYQAELGRWTQPDPSGVESNVYSYVGGNPVNFIDPLGLFSFGDFFGAIADIAGLVSAVAGLACLGGVGCPFAAVANAISAAAAIGEISLECSGGDDCDAAAAGLLTDIVGAGAAKAGYIPARVLADFAGVANDFTSP